MANQMTLGKNMVEFGHVSKSYREVRALEDISFSVKQGEILGYIGPNGAGKTTSLKILVGLIQDFGGQVTVAGNDIRNHQLAARQLGYMPQETGFQEWRTVQSALWTFGRLSGMDAEKLPARIQEVLTLVGLPDVGNRKIVNLSGGMQQKLKLAQSLIHDPYLIIMDEPMNGLDPASRYQMKILIRSLADQGKTVLFSSHILSDVQDVANTIAIINRGRILKVDTPDALRSQFQVGHDIEIKVAPGSALCTGLETIAGIENITSNGVKQLVHVSANVDLDGVIGKIWESIRTQNVKIRNFNLLYASLEDVYMKMIGEASK